MGFSFLEVFHFLLSKLGILICMCCKWFYQVAYVPTNSSVTSQFVSLNGYFNSNSLYSQKKMNATRTNAQRFALLALGRAWTLLGSRKNSKPEKCL